LKIRGVENKLVERSNKSRSSQTGFHNYQIAFQSGYLITWILQN
jgi:hypothetical protein